jgi:hypothetical protein
VTSQASDLKSAIGAVTVTLDASDISDIASAVLTGFGSDLSDIYSAAAQANSRALVAQSSLSDIYSNLADGVTIGASSLSDITSLVNAEVLNVLNSDVFAEPTGAPAATTTLTGKVGRIYQLLRNKVTVEADNKTFYADDGSVLWSKTLADNGTTYTEDEGA